jgi:vesicle coat complex subunit
LAKQLARNTSAACILRKRVSKHVTVLLQETDNPDLRDRAYVYWRLLSSDPEAARAVVLAEKPVIAQDTSTIDPRLLQTLLGNLSTLSSVYHLPPSVSSRIDSPTT